MNNNRKIKIEGIEYFIIDSIQDFRAEDSFIHRKNKLAQFSGNGEAKKHIGSYKGKIGETRSDFFNYPNWGKKHFDHEKNKKTFKSAKDSGALISENRCFFSKSNLQKYLNDAKTEYFSQEQNYHNDISEYYNERLKEVLSLDENQMFFSIYDASDNLSQKQNRGYIRSDDDIWSLWRQLILPSISYLSILKLIPINNQKAEPLFYFRILLDYQFRSFVHPKSINSEQDSEKGEIKSGEKKKTTNRKGQPKFKRDVHNYMPQCPFSKITDERLLIASHIKPHAVCINEGMYDQDVDKLNGLSLAPTYDRLFDEGYITFNEKGELICGTQLSSYTWEKLNINPNSKNRMIHYPEERELYMDFHRKNVFQDNITDFI